MCIFLDTGNLLKGKTAAPGGSRWSVAGAEGSPGRCGWEVRCVGGGWCGQGAALPVRGRRSLSAAALPALLNGGAACSPPSHQTCRIPCLALNVPCHPLVPCALSQGPGCRLGWGSWGGWPHLPPPPSLLPGDGEGHMGGSPVLQQRCKSR